MSIWNGITIPGQGQSEGERINTDTSVPGGEYVAECVEFFVWFDKVARCYKCKFAFAISTGPQAGKHLVRWSSTGGKTGEQQTRNRQHLAGDFMRTLGRLPEFTSEDGIKDQEQVRAGIIGAICKLKADPWIGDKGQPMLTVYINDTIQHGGAPAEEHDPHRDAGEPSNAAVDPFAPPIDSGSFEDDEIPF